MSLLSFFGRRAAPPEERWEPGDWAECINKGIWFRLETRQPGLGPEHGERYVVEQVSSLGRLAMLSFARFGRRRYDSRGFRKVRPQPDAAIAADGVWLPVLPAPEKVQ